jgi:hypothetical protein
MILILLCLSSRSSHHRKIRALRVEPFQAVNSMVYLNWHFKWVYFNIIAIGNQFKIPVTIPVTLRVESFVFCVG